MSRRRRLGLRLLGSDPYSPIPDLAGLPDSLWTEPAPMPGVDLRLDASADFLERELAPHIAGFVAPDGFAGNPMYPKVDGEVLFAMVRHFAPVRIVEVGAGWSTRVIAAALAGRDADHLVFDPDPAAQERAGSVPVRALTAQAIPADVFAGLRAGDVLFVDTTHTVKAGGDVLRLLLEVLPTVAPGVVVHVHDFFRPFEYPRFLMEQFGLYWQEHHLLQAFLAFNDEFEVLIANHALARLRGDRVRAVIPGLAEGEAPGSALWLRRR